MSDKLRLAAVGVGRIGVFHAQHVQELSLERGDCDLVAIVDTYGDLAARVARQLQPQQRAEIRPFTRIEDLLDARLIDAAVVAYDRKGVIDKRTFRMRDYGEKVPMFIERFGPAYKLELAHFIEQCLKDDPFSVTQQDGLNAMQVVEAGVRSLRAGKNDIPTGYA